MPFQHAIAHLAIDRHFAMVIHDCKDFHQIGFRHAGLFKNGKQIAPRLLVLGDRIAWQIALKRAADLTRNMQQAGIG